MGLLGTLDIVVVTNTYVRGIERVAKFLAIMVRAPLVCGAEGVGVLLFFARVGIRVRLWG